MRPFQLVLLCLAIFAAAACGRKSTSQVTSESPAQQSPSPPTGSTPGQSPPLSPSPTQTPQSQSAQGATLDLSRLENSVRPAVFWITVFDSSGKLLRTVTAFFISDDGKFITTARAIEDAINAVAKMADGGIYNVSGVLTVSAALDVAVLQADVKRVPFLTLSKNSSLEAGARVAVVDCGLAGAAGAAREATILAQQPDRLKIAATLSAGSIGSPAVDTNGEVVGLVTSSGEEAIVRPANVLNSLLARIASEAKPRWPESALAVVMATPAPRATPKPRLVFAPAPAFPDDVRSPSGSSWSGRFSLSFDSRGNVTKVQIARSTGNERLDRAAISTLRQWKSGPGQEWVVTVPVTFQTR
jgi:TonB family protein